MVPNQVPQPVSPVLVVEDEPMLLLIVAETLRDAGYVVWEASNGRDALQILEGQPDIVLLLTDVKMPGMDGYELAEAGMARRPDLKVLLMTGYSQVPLPKKMADAGIGVLQKPFDIDRLPEWVEQVLNPGT